MIVRLKILYLSSNKLIKVPTAHYLWHVKKAILQLNEFSCDFYPGHTIIISIMKSFYNIPTESHSLIEIFLKELFLV